MDSKKNKTKQPELIDTENRLVVAGGREGVSKMGEGSQKVQTLVIK